MIGKCSAGTAVQPQCRDRKARLWAGFTLLGLGLMAAHAVTDARDYAVLVSTVVQTAPPQIRLQWAQDTITNPTSYVISRKSPTATTWSTLATLSGFETNYADTEVAVGAQYEYQVQKVVPGYTGYGYVLAGIEVPLVESRGTAVLVVDQTFAADLAGELSLLQQDLVGDGWQVIRHDVPPDETPVNVKALIKADYAADPANVRSVFLFGHVPVPYSGDIVPDGHTPNHRGAWPADVYYADIDTDWNDKSITSTNATDPRNFNRPGDGKFDMSTVTTLADLEVGRVDLGNLPAFALPEKELLRQYLNKDHNFRHRITRAESRGLIRDNFGTFNGSAFAATGWRNFAAMFGAANVFASTNWSETLQTNSFLWGYGCGGGTYISVDGVTTTAELANSDPQVVFTFLFGSYFGDWDTQNNVMRAALATPGYTLTSAWAGRPHWFVHHMALGNTIGKSTRLTQNNSSGSPYKQINAGSLQIHVALMGDPTLRLHPIAPPTAVTVTGDRTQVTVTWTPSSEPVLGYNVYRSTNAAGPFVRVNEILLPGNTYTESDLATGDYTYMVRAVNLQTSGSGSYYNASQGAFASVNLALPPLRLTCAADQIVELGVAWDFPFPAATGGCGEIAVTAQATETNVTCGNCLVALRVWRATDACGRTEFATNIVTVVDTTAPTFSTNAAAVVELGSEWSFSEPSILDASGAATTTVISTVTNMTADHALAYTRTWEGVDACGNRTQTSQSIIVQDTTAPTIAVAPEKSVLTDSEWAFDEPIASDASGAVIVAVQDTMTNGAMVTRTWTATDAAGNSSQASQQVTLETPPKPILTIVPSDGLASESGDTGTIVISRSGSALSGLTVQLEYGGTASNGVDFLPMPATVAFAPGETTTAITLIPLSDLLHEKVEIAAIRLLAGEGYELGTPDSAQVQIADDFPKRK